MAVPLGHLGPDGPDRHSRTPAALRWDARWHSGAISAADARAAVGRFLERVRATGRVAVPDRLAQDAQLVVSELITNVVQHAPGLCGLGVEVRPDNGQVEISVWDTSPVPPTRRPPDGRRVGGHGMEIVGAVCQAVTVTALPASGKRVTARLAPPAPCPPDAG